MNLLITLVHLSGREKKKNKNGTQPSSKRKKMRRKS
jgi:hypothetical protein